jgi:hypothetical protein
MGVLIYGGTKKWLNALFHGKSQQKMDDEWGYLQDFG